MPSLKKPGLCTGFFYACVLGDADSALYQGRFGRAGLLSGVGLIPVRATLQGIFMVMHHVGTRMVKHWLQGG
ncbi:hypothetical protein B0D95_15410 [Cellvibrio sp. PSBB023]|nr:hypothetical protein B0D95_15410 [Cellvibrio sp. PSBB023]